MHGSLCTAASVPVGPNDSFTLVVTAEHLANRFKGRYFATRIGDTGHDHGHGERCSQRDQAFP